MLGLYVLAVYVWKRESDLHTIKRLSKLEKKLAFAVVVGPLCEVPTMQITSVTRCYHYV